MGRKRRRPRKSKYKGLIFCSSCEDWRDATGHHILPCRHFYGIGSLMILCRDCHDILEAKIRTRERDCGKKLTQSHYAQIARDLISGSLEFRKKRKKYHAVIRFMVSPWAESKEAILA